VNPEINKEENLPVPICYFLRVIVIEVVIGCIFGVQEAGNGCTKYNDPFPKEVKPSRMIDININFLR